MLRYLLVGNDVTDRNAAAAAQDTKDFREQLRSILCLHEVQYAVRNDAVDTVAFDQGLFLPQTLFGVAQPQPVVLTGDCALAKLGAQGIKVETQVLYHAAAEVDVRIPDACGNLIPVAAGQPEAWVA